LRRWKSLNVNFKSVVLCRRRLDHLLRNEEKDTMIRRILAGIAGALLAGVKLPFDVLADIARMIGLGSPGTPMPPPAIVEDVIDRQATELRQQLAAAPSIVTEFPKASAGHIVHAYATGHRATRDSFDASKLEEHVAVALLTMHPSQLARLALAGPEACGRWAEGCKGVVGVPLPDRDWLKRPAAAKDGSAPNEQDEAPAFRPARRAA
jgi:hypothetical protein